MSRAGFADTVAPLKQPVKDRGLWAAHLDPELGGQGIGLLKPALMREILGRTPSGPAVFGNQAPDSGNCDLVAIGSDDPQNERCQRTPTRRAEAESRFSDYRDLATGNL